ncbi:MAG TPA: hypothetical protein VIZ65_10960 [Cellvibrionaceae bacterium]
MNQWFRVCALVTGLLCTPVIAEEFNLDGFKIGKLHTGMLSAEAVGLPGCVFTKGKLLSSEADGAWHQAWSAKGCGLTLSFSAQDKKSPLRLSDMEIIAPSQLKTERGVGIGSTEAQVRTQYIGQINTEESVAQKTLVLGSMYGGVIFELNKGSVQRIFVGASAE